MLTCSDRLLAFAAQRCFTVCANSKDYCRTIFATNRTTSDSQDAYYFGNVDKISTLSAGLRAWDHLPETPRRVQNTFIFNGFRS
jgi:hypothetical protein